MDTKASVVLYQYGSKCIHPKTKEEYDPWTGHIWDSIEQLRKWNPDIPVYMITGDHEISDFHNFEKFSVTRFVLGDLEVRHDLDKTQYAHTSQDSKSWLMRNFYIESLMKKLNLENVFTFDNDVLVFSDLREVAKKCAGLYQNIAVTRESEHNVIFGMCYIKSPDSISSVNNDFWNIINTERGRGLMDMELWNVVMRMRGSSSVSNFPLWVDSPEQNTLGGIFDPISIGQFLNGTHWGMGPGMLQQHHFMHQRLAEGKWNFIKESIDESKPYYSVIDTATGEKTKILSIHVHSKLMRNLM